MNNIKTITIDGLSGVLHQNDNSQIVILLPGAASSLGANKEHYLWEIISEKADLLVINYLGHSISSGEFSVSNCIRSLEMAVDFVRGKLEAREFMKSELFKVEYKNVICAAASFGGTILANGLDLDIDKFIFIQADTAPHLDPEEINEDFMLELKEYKAIYRWQSLDEFENLIAGKQFNPLEFSRHKNFDKSIQLFHGTEDEVIPPFISKKYLEYLKSKGYTNVNLLLLEGAVHSSETTVQVFKDHWRLITTN